MAKPTTYPPQRFRIGHGTRRIMAVGCSHGRFIDDVARVEIPKARDRFKPHYCIHLGDFIDTAAFRKGAVGTGDESEDIDDDLTHGLNFLRAYRPTHLTLGNHDWRPWLHLEDNNAHVRKAAADVVGMIEKETKRLHCQTFPYMGVWNASDPKGICKIGNYLWMHGSFYGEHATRDYAERMGNVVHAHTHRAGVASGRRADRPLAFGVGALMAPGKAEYAKARAATLGWSMGVIHGEVLLKGAGSCHLGISIRPHGETQWRLPI